MENIADIEKKEESEHYFGEWMPRFPRVEKVIYKPPYTIVTFSDGTQSKACCNKNEAFDFEKGFAVAVSRRFMNFNEFEENVHRGINIFSQRRLKRLGYKVCYDEKNPQFPEE